jgi:hypothetical protein
MEEKIIERFTVIIKMPLFQEYSEYALSWVKYRKLLEILD